MSLVGLAAQHSQLALCPLMERRAPARRASECGIAARGIARTFGGGLGRSTVAHFARKVRGANIWRPSHALKIQQSNAPERRSCSLRIRGPHFASKVSYSASPQAFAECSRSASCCYATTFVWILNTMHKILPANGKITDCLIKERSFFHRIVCFRLRNSSCALCEHVL